MNQIQKPFSESGTSPPINATLSRIGPGPGRAVGTRAGIDGEGNEVSVAGDRRPLPGGAEALAAGEELGAALEDWRVIAYRRASR